MNWFDNKSNVLGLLHFLIGAEQITTKEEVIHFSQHPEYYTEVFIIYAREILGMDV